MSAKMGEGVRFTGSRVCTLLISLHTTTRDATDTVRTDDHRACNNCTDEDSEEALADEGHGKEG